MKRTALLLAVIIGTAGSVAAITGPSYGIPGTGGPLGPAFTNVAVCINKRTAIIPAYLLTRYIAMGAIVGPCPR